jgi:hypothetical protein
MEVKVEEKMAQKKTHMLESNFFWLIEVGWKSAAHPMNRIANRCIGGCWLTLALREWFSNVFSCIRKQVSQPHFWKNVRMTLPLPKWVLGSPSGLPKLQSSIAGVKTPCLEAFLISLESYRSVDVENGLAWAIWTSTTQVMAKRKVGSQIGSLIPGH